MTQDLSDIRIGWVIQLKGHLFDLEELVHWTDGNRVRVVQTEKDRFDLFMSMDVVGNDYKEVLARANEVLAVLNGLGAMQSSGFERVELNNVMHTVDENWQRRDVVVQVSGVSTRTKFWRATVLVNGEAAPDPTKGMGARVVAAADAMDAVRDALKLVGRQRPTWSELFVVYELVKANSGRLMKQEGWITEADETRFKRTANSRTALGVEARHGKDDQEPPAKPMTHDEAISLVRGLAKAWVRYMIEKSEQP